MAPFDTQHSEFGERLAAEIERLCRAGETARLRVVQEAHLGIVVIEDGNLVHAQVLENTGEDALKEMFTWDGAAWETMYGFRPVKRTITRPYAEVLADLLGRPPPPAEPLPELAEAPPPPPEAARRRLVFLVGGSLAAVAVIILLSWVEHKQGTLRQAISRSTQKLEPLITPAAETGPPPPSLTRVVPPVFSQLGPDWSVVEAHGIWLPLFATSGVSVLCSEELFSRIGAASGGWVELQGPYGKRLGARLQPFKSPYPNAVFLRPAMAQTLGLESDTVSRVAIRPVKWTEDTTSHDIEFFLIRRLPKPYCDHPLAAGVALSTMQHYGLSPGMHVVARGPRGFQSVRLQLMDRGNSAELWLSRLAQQALGVTSRWTRVVLHVRPAAGIL